MDSINNKEIYNVTLISTYDNMTKVLKTIHNWDRLNINIEALVNSEEVKRLVKKVENKTDIFLSRGATVELIRELTDIPVVNISITNFDLIKCIHKALKISNRIGILHYYKDNYELKEIENIFDIKLIYYTYKTMEEIEGIIDKLINEGVEIIIGGGLTPLYAKKRNIKSILLESSKESIENALVQCFNVADTRHKELKKNVRLTAILDSINEGIIVTNEKNIVKLYNRSAEKILNIKRSDVLDNEITKIIPNTRMHKVNKHEEIEIGQLQEINGITIVTNRIPIKINNKFFGVVSSFDISSNIEKAEKRLRKKAHNKGLFAKYNFDNIITKDERMISLKEKAKLYSMTDGTILIEGESGTGKELFAQSIHNNSLRKDYPFVAVNCGAIPEQLLESELFGYEGGAFTGANKEGKVGLFELAHKGTIFLDEIGEMPKLLQSRLLRVIQEKEIMRVGGISIIPIDIRIICATNKNLRQSVADGAFREDLYYRLNVFNISIPSLRERKQDSILIAKNLLYTYSTNKSENKDAIKLIERICKDYEWPGNIRELDNIVRRIALLQSVEELDFKDIDMNSIISLEDSEEHEVLDMKIKIDSSLKDIIDRIEYNIINYMISKNDTMEEIMKKLNISRATFMRKKSLKKEITKYQS
ncbi:sigma-54-dependent Fis family transcriptional regulator [Clostridium sp. Marseille-Q2269]|uniref:sigma-54-dependent Fis family transcriptional regulator n=1 Tax=Clostridium sp. Marseille-Q2269 TaxID=2942205 RepID=UPI00207428FF|nr:sigma-54-dependent Fis family transcriptional regulator [Clostridium sp. Marseille-Q2269]